MIKKIIGLFALLCIAPGCNHKYPKKKNPVDLYAPDENIPPKTVTVFVHGIRLASFLQRMPIFHYGFYCPQGLTMVKDLEQKYTLSNLQELYKVDPEQFNKQTFYIFGWPGKPSFKARYEAAKELYEELLKLQEKYPGLPITVITQSHGGNVGLNLGRVAKERPDTHLEIDRLVICSSPVQAATAQYVHSPIFKRIYTFYSPTDFLQIIDPQGLHRDEACDSSVKPSSFSRRHFPPDPKLVQCRVRLNSWHIGHSGFIYKPFLRQLPSLLKTLATPEGRATLPRVRGCRGATCNDYMIRITR